MDDSDVIDQLYEVITFDRDHIDTYTDSNDGVTTFITTPESSVDGLMWSLATLHDRGFELLGSVNGLTHFKHTLKIPPPPELKTYNASVMNDSDGYFIKCPSCDERHGVSSYSGDSLQCDCGELIEYESWG